jgi:hypothetical protein
MLRLTAIEIDAASMTRHEIAIQHRARICTRCTYYDFISSRRDIAQNKDVLQFLYPMCLGTAVATYYFEDVKPCLEL